MRWWLWMCFVNCQSKVRNHSCCYSFSHSGHKTSRLKREPSTQGPWKCCGIGGALGAVGFFWEEVVRMGWCGLNASFAENWAQWDERRWVGWAPPESIPHVPSPVDTLPLGSHSSLHFSQCASCWMGITCLCFHFLSRPWHWGSCFSIAASLLPSTGPMTQWRLNKCSGVRGGEVST